MRTLDNVNVFDLDIKSFDGKTELPGEWTATPFQGPLPAGGPPDGKVYTGGCHCGAVTLAVRTGDLEHQDADIREDNCSICQRVSFRISSPTASRRISF